MRHALCGAAATGEMRVVKVEQPRTGRILLEVEQERRIVGPSVAVYLCGTRGRPACTMIAAARRTSSLVDRLVLHVPHSVKPAIYSRRTRIRMKEPRVSALRFASKYICEVKAVVDAVRCEWDTYCANQHTQPQFNVDSVRAIIVQSVHFLNGALSDDNDGVSKSYICA